MMYDTFEVKKNEIEFKRRGKTAGCSKYKILAQIVEVGVSSVSVVLCRNYPNLNADLIYTLRTFFFKVIRRQHVDKILKQQIIDNREEGKSLNSHNSAFVDELDDNSEQDLLFR
jgi:hypothetical protein